MKFPATKNILFGLIIITIGLKMVLHLEYTRFDGDGLVKGIDLKPYPKYLYYLVGIFTYIFLFGLKKIWLQKILIVLLSLSLTIAGVEFIFSILKKNKEKIAQKYIIKGPSFSIILDKNLGYKLASNKKLLYRKTQNDSTLYSVNFETDSNSLRITPPTLPYPKSKYALFFGCSFTFGLGVESNETTAYYFQEKNKDFKSYNLANSGYGPHQMLARLQEGKLRNIIKERNGVAFYTYIPDHINRAISGSITFLNSEGNSPYFLQENGKMVRHGLFIDQDIFTKFFYKIINKSNFFTYFPIYYPFWQTKSHYEFIGDMLAESAKTYEKQFKNDNFYIIFYPTHNKDYSLIIDRLKQKNIKYLDYSKLFDPTLPQYQFINDGHPRALANQLLINQVIKDVKLP